MYLVLNENKTTTQIVEKPQSICGTTSKIINDDIIEGKRQFNINCAMCHPLNKKSTPNVLRLGMKHYDINLFSSYVKNVTRHRKNIYCVCSCKPFPNLDSEKINFIYKYITYSLN